MERLVPGFHCLRLQRRGPARRWPLSSCPLLKPSLSIIGEGAIGLVVSLLIISPLNSQTQNFSIVQAESKLWIEGTSTIGLYECFAHEFRGGASLKSKGDSSCDRSNQVRVVVTVESFDCGRGKMNDDMYAALKADEYAEIRYEFINGDLVEQ